MIWLVSLKKLLYKHLKVVNLAFVVFKLIIPPSFLFMMELDKFYSYYAEATVFGFGSTTERPGGLIFCESFVDDLRCQRKFRFTPSRTDCFSLVVHQCCPKTQRCPLRSPSCLPVDTLNLRMRSSKRSAGFLLFPTLPLTLLKLKENKNQLAGY